MNGGFDPWGSYRLFPGMSLNSAIDLLSGLLEAPDADALLDSLNQAAMKCGFDKFLVGMQWHGPQGNLRYRALSGYPLSWQQMYLERGFVHIDPTIQHCQTTEATLLWSERLFQGPDGLAMFEEARSHGLGYGISVPIHEMHGIKSMVSLARDKPFENSAEAHELARSGRLLANCAHFAYRKIIQGDIRMRMEHCLTPRETECLRWVAVGKTASEIGTILGLSEGTVITHMRNAMFKLDVKSRPQAVAVAFRLGLIN